MQSVGSFDGFDSVPKACEHRMLVGVRDWASCWTYQILQKMYITTASWYEHPKQMPHAIRRRGGKAMWNIYNKMKGDTGQKRRLRRKLPLTIVGKGRPGGLGPLAMRLVHGVVTSFSLQSSVSQLLFVVEEWKYTGLGLQIQGKTWTQMFNWTLLALGKQQNWPSKTTYDGDGVFGHVHRRR